MQWGWPILLAVLFFTPLNGGDTLAIHLDKYVVQDGDYLSKIQIDYPGITWKEIYSFNGGTVGDNPNLIHPDSILYIPVESSYIKGETPKTKNYTLQA